MSVNEKMTAIAAKIREKLGTTEKLGLDEMAESIDKVYEAGQENASGGGDDAFWDIYQTNGSRVIYTCAFASEGWNNKTFTPKYNMSPIDTYMMFRNCKIVGDLDAILKSYGVTLNTENCTTLSYMFMNAYNITKVGIFDLTSVVSSAGVLDSVFNSCHVLEEIELIKTANLEFAPFPVSMFRNCLILKEIRFEGIIVKGLDIKNSPLSLESAINIINHLKNYKGTSEDMSYTVSFSATTLALLDAEGDTASPNGNSWRNYISDLGWNL